MKLLNADYELKAPISTPYILEKNKWMNNQSHSSTSILHLSNQSSNATYNFHPFMDGFYIIWSLGFGQVYILDLPLLLTQNKYLNYSNSTFMPLVKRFSLYGPWSSLFYSLVLSIILPQIIILLFAIITPSNYFVVYSHVDSTFEMSMSICNLYQLWGTPVTSWKQALVEPITTNKIKSHSHCNFFNFVM